MVLENKSHSQHNSFLGSHASTTQRIPHPTSTRFYDEPDAKVAIETRQDDSLNHQMFGTPVAKRRKVEVKHELRQDGFASSIEVISQQVSSPARRKLESIRQGSNVDDEIADSEDDSAPGNNNKGSEEHVQRKTQLEEALPPVQTDEEAIEAYEAQKAAEAAEAAGPLEERGEDTAQQRIAKRSWKRGRSSIYLDAFTLALSTVLADEAHLFDNAEKQVFKHFDGLSYEAQFLYVRLFLRKTSAWFRVGKLGYHNDIADVESAVQELQLDRSLPEGDAAPEQFPGESSVPEEAVPLGRSFTFAECSDDQITTLNEASSLLLLDELKVLAKDAKVRGKNKTELLKNLRRTSGRQKGLGFLKRTETEGSATSGRSTPVRETEEDARVDSESENTPSRSITPNNDSNRDVHFTKKILERTGKCVRLSLTPLKLFERVHLVFYRSIEWTEKSLTTLILAGIARRNFPEYIVSRSANIFENRSMLLEFESCLRLQFRVENMLEYSGYATHRDLEEIRALFERVYPRGIALLKAEQSKEDRIYESGEGPYLRRFSPAWVYIRITHKVLPILARFKEHLREHVLLCELLDQRLFHPSKRGAWYQRKALLEEHYMHALTDDQNRSEEANKKHWKRIALRTCETGLQDRECHIKYHYDLQKRIKKLEKQLKIPKREQHDFGHVGLTKPRERYVEGIQIIRNEQHLVRRKSSNSDLPTFTREQSSNSIVNNTNVNVVAAASDSAKRGGKTMWLDTLDTNEPVSVESLTLSHYRKTLHYKGFHTEGGILRTLFGLLFYDVLFVYVPNVFQTAYQTCPLDLHTDSFYSTRLSEINARINELSNGHAESILRRVWHDHAEKKTCIVGVKWDFEFDDLVEITRCWEGAALGTVMRVLAQEYAERGGGVPDLFLWKPNFSDQDEDTNTKSTTTVLTSDEVKISHLQSPIAKPRGHIMFVEVKSENDRLSDTQRLWISVLLNAGINVELCHVLAFEVRRENGEVVETKQEGPS